MDKAKPQKKAISYLRYSSKKQATGESEKRQLEWTAEYCENNNLKLVDTYKDLGISAHRGKHSTKGNLARLLEDCASGKIPKGYALIIENFDRLSREEVAVALQRFLTLLNDYQLEIHTLDDDRVYTSENLAFTELIISIVIMGRAHSESVRKSVFITKSWEAVRKAGKAFSKPKSRPLGKHPSWLDWDWKKQEWVTKKDKVEIIRYIFELSIDKKLGRSAIAQRLNAEKVSTITSRTTKWSAAMIQTLLINRAVVGVFNPALSKDKDAKPIANYYPEIVTQKAFEDAQRASRNRNKRLTGRPSNDTQYSILKGIGFYRGGSIRKSQYRNGDNVTHSYVATVEARNRFLGKTEHIDHFVCSLLSELDNNEVSANPSNQRYVLSLNSQIQEKNTNLKSLREQYNNVTQALVLANGSLPDLVTKLQQLNRDITLEEDAIAELKSQLLEIETGSGIYDKEELVKLKDKALVEKELQARQDLHVTLSKLVKRLDLAKDLKDLALTENEIEEQALMLHVMHPMKYWARIELFNDAVVLGGMTAEGQIARLRWEDE